MAAPIENYAMLGDCRSAALVSRDGSIDWLCLPRFDSATPFAALLGGPENGTWQIAPDEAYEASRAYRDGTMVLETRFRTARGTATLIDFMPVDTPCPGVVRIVEGVEGEVCLRMNLVMRFDYGHIVPWVEHVDPQTLTAVAGPDMLVLRTGAPPEGVNQHTRSRFTVRPGQRVAFCLFQQASHLPVAEAIDAEAALDDTQAWWREFSGRCPAVGPYGEQVKRSLITMKALTYRPTGGIVAAVTTSLPEWPGGERNWDPLLLAARRHDDADSLHEARLFRGSLRVARLADALHRRQPGADAGDVRRQRRASAMAPRASANWTSTAKWSMQ